MIHQNVIIQGTAEPHFVNHTLEGVGVSFLIYTYRYKFFFSIFDGLSPGHWY